MRPIALRLLGAADLLDAGGDELRDVVRQPKRLALLAYLAAERAPRYHRRDSLLALFWPELDDRHARASLRRTLHFLRAHLGDEVLLARGDELAVDAERVWCDVPAFQAELEEGRPERALELYRGDLLEGFFVPSAPGFERWLDAERERLRRAAAGAVWQLAETREASGDAAEAARWGRRAAELAPDDEVALRRLLALFDRLGDRAAAVQVYEDFAQRLKQELDLDPSPETRALIEGVRARVRLVAAPPAAPPPPAPELAPNRIAVLPFAVRGGADLGYLREGLVDLLSVKLDGAGDLRTVDPHALLGHVQTLGLDELDPASGRAAAARFGAGAFLLGSLVSAGDRLLVRVTLYPTAAGDEVRVDAEAAGEAGLAAVVDEVVRRLLADRSTSLGGHLGRLGATMTASLPALKGYLAGEQAFRRGRYLEAARAYERALAEDEAFALARYRLAATRAAAGRLDEARVEAAAATRGHHLAVHVRLLLAGQVAWLDGDLATAERRYLAVLDDRPEDVDAWSALGRLLFDGNPLRGRRAADARDALERTVALDPRHVGALAQLARLAALDGRSADVAELVERYLALTPDGDDAAALHALRAGVRGAPGDLAAVPPRLAAAPPGALARSLLDLALLAPGGAAALDLLDRLGGLTPAAALGPLPQLVAAHSAAAHGLADRAARALDQAERQDPDVALAHRAWLALVSADVPALDRLAERLESGAPASATQRAESPVLTAMADPGPAVWSYLSGMIAARRGRPDEAERHAAACAASDPEGGERPLGLALSGGVRAAVALARGDAAAALQQLEGIMLGPWIHRTAWSPFAALAAERLARGEALLALGRRDEAGTWLSGLGVRSVFELACRPRARELLAAH